MLNNPDYGQMEMGMAQDYENPKVQEISNNLGEFDYGASASTYSGNLEFRPLQFLENQAKFEG